ncbi:MAG: adenosylmethionine decarboxylase [Alphaproteobacteria bacterium]|nr:adenosylmethionine decarboxylase [Alphaproteobacteria bacterium]
MSASTGAPGRDAGVHLIIDFWGSTLMNDGAAIEAGLRRAAAASGEPVLYAKLHRFEPMGVTGVVVLPHAHLTIHTWPERGYAAIDVLLQDSATAHAALALLKEAFQPTEVQVSEQRRGVLP